MLSGVRQAEVDDEHAIIPRDEHVLRLEIAMHEPGRVRRCKPAAGRQERVQELASRPLSLRLPGPQIQPVDELHRDPHAMLVNPGLVHRDHVRMRQASHGLGLAQQPAAIDVLGPARHDLERDTAPELGVAGHVHHTEPAATDLPLELEPADAHRRRIPAEQRSLGPRGREPWPQRIGGRTQGNATERLGHLDVHYHATGVDDLQALQAWANGDAAAGRAFYRRHAERIAAFVTRKLPDEAADVVQRVFLRCLQAVRDGREIRHPRGLLYAIARRELVDHLAARTRAAFDPLVTSFADVATSPTQRLVRHEAARALAVALDALPLDHQLALELYYWEELSTQDVADALGISRSAAINRLHRARAQLRERLASASAGEAESAALAEIERWGPPEPESEA